MGTRINYSKRTLGKQDESKLQVKVNKLISQFENTAFKINL